MYSSSSKKQNKIIYLLFAAVFFQSVLASSLISAPVQAAQKKISLTKAQDMAISNSAQYRKILNKIEIQEIKYATAVKSIKMKKKNMSTFRWTPLLSFKFPEKPTLDDEYEWQYKPLQITCAINGLKHQLNDEKLASRERVSLVYVETYICQEKIGFYEESQEKAKKILQNNMIKLALGEADQADIDKMQQKISRLTTDLALQMRTFEAKKSQLSKLINLDVTSGYLFQNPFVEAEIPRSILEQLVDYTLDNDQQFYETKLETSLSLESLNMMKSMMRNQYGSKMNGIEPYIQQALQGITIDSSAFKKDYNQMLKNIDEPWDGHIRILFIKINKEWFKGAVAGSRYVEDDPYALYSGALEYADAVREKKSAQEELTQAVKDNFETVKTTKLAYSDAVRACDALEKDLDKSLQLNRIGVLTYEELSDMQEEYEQQQLARLELLGEYSSLLYAYDRLTCGGITAYLEGTDINMTAASGGNSFLADEIKGEAYYYIEYAVEDNLFRLGVSIPEDFSIDITHFELYVNGEQVGERTKTADYLEHLALDLDRTESVKLYLYNDGKRVDICEIDASVYQDKVDIKGGYILVQANTVKTVASYSCGMDSSTGMATLFITPQNAEPIAYYRLEDEAGNVLAGDTWGKELTEIDRESRYLSLLAGDLSKVQAVFYDKSETLLYKGSFNTATGTIEVYIQRE
ncbi:MAG: hypothetical protein K2N73_11075 [Lachnospiraceae bacterium]|nr:hypothetical protein [Lachnospiraceae bacterium]